ncbi:MAG: FG-GAP-like repeat-containing protein [Myxococcaceae bacterium]|nr:FG-GAP-like repeat-containing protein [Myxococcaceae bacterium]
MKRFSFRVAMAALSVAALHGCSCGTPPDECGDLVVTFTNPTDGQTSPATTDVNITVEDTAGNKIDLDTATLVTRLSTSTEFSTPVDGTVETGKATFSAVHLESGTNLLKATVKKKGTACVGGKTITVTVDEATPPKVLTFKFPQDLNGDGVLAGPELPTSAKIRVDLTFQGVAGGQVQVLDGTTVVGLQSVGANSASLDLDLGTITDKTYALFAKVTKGTLSNDAATNPEASASITVKRTMPTCAVIAPTKAVLGPADDADPAKAKFQLRTAATVGSSTKTVELKLIGGAGATSGMKTPVAGGLSFDFDVDATGETAYTVQVEALDELGNKCTATKMVTADFKPPTVTITSPTAAGSPYTTSTISVSANVNEGGTVHYTATQSPVVRDLGTVTVAAGKATTSANFLNGTYVLTAVATDLAGNDSAPVTETFTVNSSGCTVVFTQPNTRPALISASPATFKASSNCNNTAVTLLTNGANPRAATTNASGLASWTFPVTNGTYKFRVEIGSGASLSFDEIDVTVDTNAPVITSPVTGPQPTVLNAIQDVNRAVAGVQRALNYTATVPVGGRVDVCTDMTPAPGNAVACPDGTLGFWVLKGSQVAGDPAFTFPEGSYGVKVVVVSGATTVASAVLNLIVDGVRPDFSAVSLVGDTNGDKRLNIAELGGQAPKLSVTLGRGDVAANIASIVVKDRIGGGILNTQAGVSLTGATGTVTLNNGVTTTEQTYDLEVQVLDTAGNSNVLALATTDDPLDAEAIIAGVRVDLQAPSCAFTAPTLKLFGVADDADGATAGYQLRASVATAADGASVKFDLSGAATQTATKTVAQSAATNDFTVSPTGTLTYALAATCTDQSGNTATATPVTGVVVDNDPPTCAITAPVASPPAYGSFSIPTTVTVGGANGQPVTVLSQQGAGTPQTVGTLTVNAGSASGTLSYPFSGAQTVTAKVSDLAGNSCTTAPVSISINAVGCSLAFTSPSAGAGGKVFINRAADTNPGTATTAEFAVTGHTSNCGAGLTVSLFQVGNGTPLGTGLTDGNGDVTVNGSLPESATPVTLRLRIDNGAGVTTDVDLTPVIVDLTPPSVTSATPAGTTLTFVAATNKNVGSPGVVVDSTVGAPANFTVTVNGITGALNGAVQLYYQGTPVGAAVAVDADPKTTLSFAAQLTHDTTGTFEIRVSDEAGNSVSPTSASAQVDVEPPGAPTVTASAVDRRAATVKFSWAPTFDDLVGAGNARAHQGYEVRWTTSSVTNGHALVAESDWLGANAESNSAYSASTIDRVLTLPPLNTYYVGVRAIDEVGNYSAYSGPSATFGNALFDVLTNPGAAGAAYGRQMAVGKLNGDTLDDLVVSAESANRVYVYFGSASFFTASSTCTLPACQAIDLPGGATTDNFGTDVSVGQVGDVAAENKPDLLVSDSTYSGATGRAFLFFGSSTTSIDTASVVEFRGSAAGTSFGRAVRAIQDLDGDGLGEIAVAAPSESTPRGRIYIYKGRSQANWNAAKVGGVIPTSAANWIIEGPVQTATTVAYFGRARNGFAAVTDFDGDGRADLTIPGVSNLVNKMFLFTSAAISASSAGTPLLTGDSPVANNALQTLSRVTSGSNGRAGQFNGYSVSALGGVDLLGSTAADLAVGNVFDGFVDLHDSSTAGGFSSSPSLTVSCAAGFGNAIRSADVNGDGKNDLAITETLGSNASGWLFYARQGSFDTQCGGGYWTSRIQSSTANLVDMVFGDFDGDSKPDLAISDNNASPGKVSLWH